MTGWPSGRYWGIVLSWEADDLAIVRRARLALRRGEIERAQGDIEIAFYLFQRGDGSQFLRDALQAHAMPGRAPVEKAFTKNFVSHKISLLFSNKHCMPGGQIQSYPTCGRRAGFVTVFLTSGVGWRSGIKECH